MWRPAQAGAAGFMCWRIGRRAWRMRLAAGGRRGVCGYVGQLPQTCGVSTKGRHEPVRVAGGFGGWMMPEIR